VLSVELSRLLVGSTLSLKRSRVPVAGFATYLCPFVDQTSRAFRSALLQRPSYRRYLAAPLV
jgi:hypothetical protein